MSQLKMNWAWLPASIRDQAAARWGGGGPGDGYLYHWIQEAPPADYCGPLPFGRIVRRTKER